MADDKKQRSENYEPKLKVNGSFIDVVKASVTPPKPKTESPKK